MKKIILIFLSLFLMVSVSSCGFKNSNAEYEAEIYYANSEKTQLLAEKRNVSTKGKEVYEAVMEEMLKAPKSQALNKVIPDHAQILGVERKGENLKIDFTKEIYTENETENILIRTAILRTMTSIDGIESIELWVEGEPMRNALGKLIGILNKEDIVYDTNPDLGEKKYIKLYFSDKDAQSLVAESREIDNTQKDTLEMRVIKELLKGPVNSSLVKTIPQETKILSVETKEGVCFVNLSQDFIAKHPGGSAGEMMTIYSVVNSLTELEEVEKVQFLVEGQKMDVFIHMVFNEPFVRDEGLIK